MKLPGKSLMNAALPGAKLGHANLRRRNLSGSDLRGADLRKADLRNANLKNVDLNGANLSGADLTSADLSFTNLNGADLSRTILSGATCKQTILTFAKLYRTSLGYTTFLLCDTLDQALALHTVRHYAPSHIDYYTLRQCAGGLPQEFLRGIGFTRDEIDNLVVMYSKEDFVYYSCFISHARADGDFSEQLYRDLQANGISCWHYRHDMRGGREWRRQISDAIKKHEKLILVCSRKSIYRKNVVDEILDAIDEERRTGEKKLFPIRLDDHILGFEMLEEGREKVRSGEWRENWVFYVQKLEVPDFSNWQTKSEYRGALKNLLRDLRNEEDSKGG